MSFQMSNTTNVWREFVSWNSYKSHQIHELLVCTIFPVRTIFKNLGLSVGRNYPFLASKQIKNDAGFKRNIHALVLAQNPEKSCLFQRAISEDQQ